MFLFVFQDMLLFVFLLDEVVDVRFNLFDCKFVHILFLLLNASDTVFAFEEEALIDHVAIRLVRILAKSTIEANVLVAFIRSL